MSYYFDIIGISSVLDFFYYQQKVEQSPARSRAYLGSHECTLDSFIESTNMIVKKPNWNWEQVTQSMVSFWLTKEEEVKRWQETFPVVESDILIVGRIANIQLLKQEFRSLLND